MDEGVGEEVGGAVVEVKGLVRWDEVGEDLGAELGGEVEVLVEGHRVVPPMATKSSAPYAVCRSRLAVGGLGIWDLRLRVAAVRGFADRT